MELDRETISKFSAEEKKALYDFLISEGIDPVYLEWLVYGRNFNDVVEKDIDSSSINVNA